MFILCKIDDVFLVKEANQKQKWSQAMRFSSIHSYTLLNVIINSSDTCNIVSEIMWKHLVGYIRDKFNFYS